MAGRNKSAALRAPFPLYGLPAEERWHRTVDGAAIYDDATSQVKLGHRAIEPARGFVQVIILGPLHGTDPPAGGVPLGNWEVDPVPLATFHVAESTRSGPPTSMPTIQAVLETEWLSVSLPIDGIPSPSRLIQRGDYWASISHLSPDNAIIVLASEVTVASVHLDRLHSVAPYLTR